MLSAILVTRIQSIDNPIGQIPAALQNACFLPRTIALLLPYTATLWTPISTDMSSRCWKLPPLPSPPFLLGR